MRRLGQNGAIMVRWEIIHWTCESLQYWCFYHQKQVFKQPECSTDSSIPSSYTNVTNQPTFGCANSSCLLTCDNQIRFYHTNLTTGKYAPQGISASISIAPSAKSGLPFFRHGAEFVGAKGVKVAQAFVEFNFLECGDLKGGRYLGV